MDTTAEMPATKADDIAAAPSTITLAGKKFVMRPLDDDGYAEYEKWVQNRFSEVALKNAQEFVDDKQERLSLMQSALAKAATLTISSAESLMLMTSFEGASKLVYLYLRMDNEVTEKQVATMLADPKTLTEAMKMIDMAEGWLGAITKAMTEAADNTEKEGNKRRKKVVAAKKKKRTHRRH